MFRVEQLSINPETPQELQKISTDLVGYVIDKPSKKVISVNVISRRAIPDWYKSVTDKYSSKDFIFCLGSISFLGTIVGIQVMEVDEVEKKDGDDKSTTRKPGDNYHVN